LKIDNADGFSRSWRLEANRALHVEGELLSDFYGGIVGFRLPGNRADYAIDVQKPLTVSFVLDGAGLDRCAPIDLLVDGNAVEVKSRSAERIVFGSVALPAGTVPLSLAVADDAKAGSAAAKVTAVTLRLEE